MAEAILCSTTALPGLPRKSQLICAPGADGDAIADCGVAFHITTWGAAWAFAVSIAINCSNREQTYCRS
jgi:hypothetical protein